MPDNLGYENLGGGVWKNAEGKFLYLDQSNAFIGPFDSEDLAREMLAEYEEDLEDERISYHEGLEDEEDDWFEEEDEEEN